MTSRENDSGALADAARADAASAPMADVDVPATIEATAAASAGTPPPSPSPSAAAAAGAGGGGCRSGDEVDLTGPGGREPPNANADATGRVGKEETTSGAEVDVYVGGVGVGVRVLDGGDGGGGGARDDGVEAMTTARAARPETMDISGHQGDGTTVDVNEAADGDVDREGVPAVARSQSPTRVARAGRRRGHGGSPMKTEAAAAATAGRRRLPTVLAKLRARSKAKVEKAPKVTSSPVPRSSGSKRSGSNDTEMPPPPGRNSDSDSGDPLDSSQSEFEPGKEGASTPSKADTNLPRKRSRRSASGSDSSERDEHGDDSSSTGIGGCDDTDDGSDFNPGEEGDDSSETTDETSPGTPQSPPPAQQCSTRPTKKRRGGTGSGGSSITADKSAKIVRPRKRPVTRGNDGVPQPHLSIAYRGLDDARRRRWAASAKLRDARRRLEEAQAAVGVAEAECRGADAALSRRGGEVVVAELRVRPSRWNDMYRRLAAYQLRHGHCLLSRRIPGTTLGRGGGGEGEGEGEDDDPDLDKLAKWVFNQRRYLKAKRGEAADVFGGGDEDAEATAASGNGAWDGKASRKANGGGNRWCKAYRIAALDRLGFVWEEEVEIKWTMNLRRLAQYNAEHGHCHVPQRYKPDMALGRWVNGQRVHYRRWREGKPTHMTDERYRKLREVGFVFHCDNAPRHRVQHLRRRQTAEEAWEERFWEFAEFRTEHGHGHLCQDNAKRNVELCRWATFQRKQFKLYKEGKPSLLTREKVERLDSLGFYWSIKEARADLPHMGGRANPGVEEGLAGRAGDGETDVTTTGDGARSGADEAADAGDHSCVMTATNTELKDGQALKM